MSQNQRPKTKLEVRTESVIQVKLPMVRNFSTGGGHGPEDTLVEGDLGIVTKKWQGYPPANLNVIGKPMPPMPEVSFLMRSKLAFGSSSFNLTGHSSKASVFKKRVGASPSVPGWLF